MPAISQPVAPTWLLIDYDWSATRQAARSLLHCSDIVVVPRLKWFEDSHDTGKDNHAWFGFDVRRPPCTRWVRGLSSQDQD